MANRQNSCFNIPVDWKWREESESVVKIKISSKIKKLCEFEDIDFWCFFGFCGFSHFSVKTWSDTIKQSYPRIILLILGYPTMSWKLSKTCWKVAQFQVKVDRFLIFEKMGYSTFGKSHQNHYFYIPFDWKWREEFKNVIRIEIGVKLEKLCVIQ